MMSEEFKMQIGEQAPDFILPAIDGKAYTLQSFTKNLLVVVFTCNHCPYVKAYENKLIALAKGFSGSCDFLTINSNDASKYPEDSFAKMKERAAEKKFTFPYLNDASQKTARAYGALVTPHVFLFDSNRKLAYQGGVDDRFRSGDYNNEEAATAHYLADALKGLGSATGVKRKTSPVVGCSIKWK